MIVDTRPARRIGKSANQVKFGKQPNGTPFPVAMSPTNRLWHFKLNTEDYRSKSLGVKFGYNLDGWAACDENETGQPEDHPVPSLLRILCSSRARHVASRPAWQGYSGLSSS